NHLGEPNRQGQRESGIDVIRSLTIPPSCALATDTFLRPTKTASFVHCNSPAARIKSTARNPLRASNPASPLPTSPGERWKGAMLRREILLSAYSSHGVP